MNFKRIGNNLIDWIIMNSPKNVFHASSGACAGIKLVEDWNYTEVQRMNFIGRKSAFIESRKEVENSLLCLRTISSTKVAIGRLFSFIGPELIKKKQYAISQFLSHAIAKETLVVKGNPNTVRSYLHEDEMSDWILKTVFAGVSGEVLDIGSSAPVSLGELPHETSSLTGVGVK